ncbi:hypothetical protein AMTR_s00023p00224670 [Amborella trichopoda]|uniref:Uncharacterized protein n=1 Tax=Amborella trichopoda TaxID=13333 RepID=W1NJM9_AMBTC|nr:hypothetical protein AMTR_s00023p00224670 [Amborella trichopoda]
MVSRSSEVVNNSKILVETLGFLVSKGFGLPYLLDLDQGVSDIKGILVATSRVISPCRRGGFSCGKRRGVGE